MNILRVTVGDILDETASKFADSEALVDIPQGVRLSYKRFLEEVELLARGFLRIGIDKGNHVALWSPNRWEWIVTQFALAKIGAVLVSVDVNYQLDQLEYLLKQSDSKVLILSEGLKSTEYIKIIKTICPEIGSSLKDIGCSKLPELKQLILISEKEIDGMIKWKDLFEMGEEISKDTLIEKARLNQPEDVITLLYTSGTTGAPKGVMSTHFGVINTTLASAENQRLNERDRLCLSVPLSHMFGCICITLAAIIKGATIVIPSETFDSEKILEAVEKERCTALYGSPNAFISLMNSPKYGVSNLQSLRTGIMGGAQCPMEIMKKVMDEMGIKEIVIGYGQTEASSWITMTSPDDPIELRVTTVGRPLPNIEVKIIDPHSGSEAKKGEIGEICARGFNMKGYYKMPAATASAIDSEGWLHTGDLGSMDEDGYVKTTGRIKEIINKGGEIIYPTEIEEIIFSHPKILNVQIFGVPDRELGEEIAAWVKLEEGADLSEEEIIKFFKEKLPPSHVPRYLKIVSDFPTTPLGKIQKFKMREITIKEYGLE